MENWQIFLIIVGSLIVIPIIFYTINYHKRPIISDMVEVLETWQDRHDREMYSYILLSIKNPPITKKVSIDNRLFYRYRKGEKISVYYKIGRINQSVSILNVEIP